MISKLKKLKKLLFIYKYYSKNIVYKSNPEILCRLSHIKYLMYLSRKSNISIFHLNNTLMIISHVHIFRC